MAVRRGMAAGGDGCFLPAAAARAGGGGGARGRAGRDRGRDAGAGRSARAARGRGAVPRLHARRAPRVPPRRLRGPRRGRSSGRSPVAAALRSRLRVGRGRLRAPRRRPAGALRRLRDAGTIDLWASAATHAVLPLLATEAGVRLQLETGLRSHRARFGGVERRLLAAGVRVPAGPRGPACGSRRARLLRRPDRRCRSARPARARRRRCGRSRCRRLGHDPARLGRARISGGSGVSRLPLADDQRDARRGATAASPTTTKRARRGRASTHATSSTRVDRARSPHTAPRAGGRRWSSARSTRSCSATGGTRGPCGSRR